MNNVNFKSESEVKEYLANIETEFSYQCHREKTAEGCYMLGEFYAAIKSDFTKAASAYDLSCTKFDNAAACNKLAALNLYGKGVAKDRSKAVDLFRRSCDGGYMTGCYGAGVALSGGVTKDAPQAIKFLERACASDHQESCYQLGSIYLQGMDPVKRDLQCAFKYTLKSCELDHMYGCANVSRMYKIGDGTDVNERLSVEFKAKAKELHRRAKEKKPQMKFGETGNS